MSWKNFTRLLIKPTTGSEVPEADPSGVDIDAILANTQALAGDFPDSTVMTTPSTPEMVSTSDAVSGTTALVPNRPLAEIYAEYRVPPSPKTVDEILAFLERIAQMAPKEQAQIIEAMDAADDKWDISDVIADAQAKIQILGLAKQGLDGRLQAALADSRSKISTADAAIEHANTTIGSEIATLRQQIAELEALRDETISTQETAKATALSEQASARSLAQTEATRYDSEVAKLTTFINTFSPTT